MKISGQPVANLFASTSGTDSDWVVKLIDVYPDEVAGQAAMGGYQLMVSADIFRGRYRESLETPKPIAAGKPLHTASPYPRRIMFFCRGTGLWCRFSPAGFRCMTATRRPLSPAFFGHSREITKRRFRGSTTRPVKPASSNYLWSPRPEATGNIAFSRHRSAPWTERNRHPLLSWAAIAPLAPAPPSSRGAATR